MNLYILWRDGEQSFIVRLCCTENQDDEDDSIREELCYRHPGPPFRGPVNDHESGKPANYPTQACSRTGQLHRNSPLAPKEGFTLGAVYLGLDYTRVAALIYPKICRAIQEKISLAQMMVQIRRKHRSCCGIGNSNAPWTKKRREDIYEQFCF